jgi:hypothetical protein
MLMANTGTICVQFSVGEEAVPKGLHDYSNGKEVFFGLFSSLEQGWFWEA